MKTIAAGLVAVLYAAGAFAQSFTPDSGFTSTSLFTTGEGSTITGVGADSSGDLFYLETGDFGGNMSDTQLLERTPATSYASATQLYDFGTPAQGNPVTGDFVRVNGNTVYFGESSAGGVYSISTGGGSATLITTATDNYDLQFSGTSAFLSYNPGGFTNTDNLVAKLNPSTGQTQTVLDTQGDYSGPIAFDTAGSLYYGSTTYGSNPAGGVYKFTAAQVSNALTSGTALTLADGTAVFDNGSNGYLNYLDGSLFASQNPASGQATITQLNLLTSGTQAVGLTGTGDFFFGTDVSGTTLYADVTADFTNGPSTIYAVQPVPEPGSFALLLAGSAGCLAYGRLRRR